jgi:hypothetical protein
MQKSTINQFVDMRQMHLNNNILAPTGHLGISRNQMPQIDSKFRDKFIDFIEERGIKVRHIRVPAKSLKTAQGEYNRDKVASMIQSGENNLTPIIISKDGFVIDGMHRLIAKLNMIGVSTYMNVIELGMEAIPLLSVIDGFDKVRYRNINDSLI